MTTSCPAPLVRVFTACLAAATLAATALAQPADGSEGQPATTRPPIAARLQAPVSLVPLIDVNFPGGPVSAYCEAVRAAASPNVVNIILNEGVGDVILPAISLRQVTVEVAMKTLTMTGQAGNLPPVLMDRLADQGSSAYVLRASGSGRSLAAAPRKTAVHSLRSIVEPPPGMPNTSDVAIPVDTVMAALTTAVRADDQGAEAAPELMLHRESLMLICRGTGSQQNIVENVLGELDRDMTSRRNLLAKRLEVNDKARLERITSEAELKQAELQVARASDECARADAMFEQIKQRVESGLGSKSELLQAQGDVAGLRSNLEAAKAQLQMVKARAAVIAERDRAMSAVDRTVVVYDLADFASFKDDILAVVSALLDDDNGRAQWTNNSLVATATPDQHHALKTLLLTLRRVKANDPKLAPSADWTTPGLDDSSGR